MSKDIRSFFTATAKKPITKPTGVKRKALVISSDEDESESSVSSDKKPKVDQKLSDKPNLSKINRIPDEKKIVGRSVKVGDFFGSEPIKREPKIIQPVQEASSDNVDSHFSADFELPEISKKDSNDDETRHEKKRMAAILYQKYKNRSGPINPGSKKIPIGKPDCFAGLTFVITGVLESLEREESIELIKKYGGKITTTLSKKTNYMIAGDDAGLAKLAKSDDLKIPILSENDLLDLIRTSGEQTKETKFVVKTKADILEKGAHIKPQTIIKEVNRTNGSTDKNFITELKETNTKMDAIRIDINNKKQSIHSPENPILSSNSQAWVEKYKPSTTKQIIGQQGSASNCEKLSKWLQNWFKNRSSGKKVQKPNPWAKNDDGSYYKAALLSGPPGVGKTTTVSLVCKEMGYDTVEFNASDTRSKRLLKEEVSELLSNKSLYGYFYGATAALTAKHVLIMDEVDGMAGNEDRGGIQELILLIKETSIPIICMCNDRNHQKIRSLVNYCYDLRFNRPRLEQIKGAMMSICFKEKIKLSPKVIEEIISATNHDIRQTLNHLTLLSAEKSLPSNSFNNQTIKNSDTAKKDMKLGPWDVVRKVFSAEEHKCMSLNEKSDLFFYDYSLGPLFVQQNYLIVSPHVEKSDILTQVALTADSLSLGDLVENRIRSKNAWSMLPTQAMFSSVLPGEYMKGHFTGQINFPAWLGKYSKSNKRKRLAQEIHDHTRIRTSGSRLSVRLDYVSFLIQHIIGPLKQKGLEGVPEALEILRQYHLLREDLDSLLELTSWPGKKNLFDSVEAKVKAALTRAYNKEINPYVYSASVALKKKKSENPNDELSGYGDVEQADVDGLESDDEETNNVANDVLIKAFKKHTSKAVKTPKEKKGKSAKDTSVRSHSK